MGLNKPQDTVFQTLQRMDKLEYKLGVLHEKNMLLQIENATLRDKITELEA